MTKNYLQEHDCPWLDIDTNGENLSLEDFLSVHVVRIATNLKKIPLYYAGHIDLTLPQWRILSALAHHGAMPMKDLARMSASDKSLVSRTVKELERKGVLETRTAIEDGRSIICHITDAGSELINIAMPLAKSIHAKILLSFNKRERVQLHRLLKKLDKIMNELE